MSRADKTWQVYLGGSHVGTLVPTGVDGGWVMAEFQPAAAWGNFAPWFQQAAGGSEDAFNQILQMGFSMVADQDGETIDGPHLYIDGSAARFAA